MYASERWLFISRQGDRHFKWPSVTSPLDPRAFYSEIRSLWGVLHPAREARARQRPFEPPQRPHLLSLLVAQDVCHPGGGAWPLRLVKRLGSSSLLAGFHPSLIGRFWVSPEGARGTFRRIRRGAWATGGP
jgi:hypothetical protein